MADKQVGAWPGRRPKPSAFPPGEFQIGNRVPFWNRGASTVLTRSNRQFLAAA